MQPSQGHDNRLAPHPSHRAPLSAPALSRGVRLKSAVSEGETTFFLLVLKVTHQDPGERKIHNRSWEEASRRSGCDHSLFLAQENHLRDCRVSNDRHRERKRRARDVSQGRTLLVSRGVHCYPLDILARASLEIPLGTQLGTGASSRGLYAGELGRCILCSSYVGGCLSEGRGPGLSGNHMPWKQSTLPGIIRCLPLSLSHGLGAMKGLYNSLHYTGNLSTLSPRDISFPC